MTHSLVGFKKFLILLFCFYCSTLIISSLLFITKTEIQQCVGDGNILIDKDVNSSVSILHWEYANHWTGWGQQSGFYSKWGGYQVYKEPCPYDCQFIGEQSLYKSADMVLFEPQQLGKRGPKYPAEKICGQKYAMITYETPFYFPIQADKDYLSHMDWRISYQKQSDIRISLMCGWGFDLNDYIAPGPSFLERKKFAIFVASNCKRGGAKQRTEYVEELMKYIPIDSYGLCLRNVPEKALSRNTELNRFIDKVELFRQYKFILAFENNNYTDYVTEKLSHAFLGQSLPVYMGAPNVDEWLPGHKSIIKTDDFSSPKDLANHLLKLATNQPEYESYFDWKKRPLRKEFIDRYHECVLSAECRICKKVVEERQYARNNSIGGTFSNKQFSSSLDSFTISPRFYVVQKYAIISLFLFLFLYILPIIYQTFISRPNNIVDNNHHQHHV
ncbi:hypothetical protein CYY_001485 [Polysphondylium violaceum]|uniref:Fucosyltransferase n=1 Tax=Polysphondylium violaceum TaxID=133409 RepID=A0A8J4Q9C0_9MYCE|nr:hypothetical protein CYY_001485 [Polysphondylium violaceum]